MAKALWQEAKRTTRRYLRARGYDVVRVEDTRNRFEERARPILERHNAQTIETVELMRGRYSDPIFGIVPVWSVVEMLSHVVDRVDTVLMNVSQEIHVLQLLEGLQAQHADEDLLLAAILHDLGKVLDLVGEDHAYIGGLTEPIGEYEVGVGLDRCVFQWSHDEFGYSRFAGRVPDHIAWLIRHHSMNLDTCLHLMDDRDRYYYETYWKPFNHMDCSTKSIDVTPTTRISDYRDIIEEAFPAPIPF